MRTLVLVGGLLCSTIGANAADVFAERFEMAASWSGLYAGAHIGGVVGGRIFQDYDVGSGTDPNDDYRLTPDGWLGGLHIGYNHQLSSSIVIGAEVDWSWSDTGADGANGGGAYISETELLWMASGRARVGYASDRWMPYLTAGVAATRMRFTEFQALTPPVFEGTGEATMIGWSVGAGTEFALTDQWLLRGEYRYSDFGNKEFQTFNTGGSVATYGADVRTHDLRLGVSYRF